MNIHSNLNSVALDSKTAMDPESNAVAPDRSRIVDVATALRGVVNWHYGLWRGRRQATKGKTTRAVLTGAGADHQFQRDCPRTASMTVAIICLMMTMVDAARAQPASCPASGESPCQSNKFCIGMNTGFFGATNRDFAFIDLMRGAHITVDRFTPNDIVRNSQIPLDANKYPTVFGVDIDVLFYSNRKTGKPYQTMPSGRFVVMWDGSAADPKIVGNGISEVVSSSQRIEFSLDTTFDTHAVFRYQNASRTSNVKNIRIVPVKYEEHYRFWSWNYYRIGASTNPPIFFPAWLEKMSVACTIRYINSTGTNDPNAIHFERDSRATRMSPATSVWYQGFNLGPIAKPQHLWPWELVVEATLQTKTIPWINFRVYSYENILKNDRFVQDIAALFHTHYGGQIYVEYANEVWNYGWPFTISTRHVEKNGPGDSQDLNENYALRSNLVQKTFAQAYGTDPCLAVGVMGTQATNPWNAGRRMLYADLDYIDVLSPAAYIGDNVSPDANVWPFLERLNTLLDDGTIDESVALNMLQDELLTGRRGAMIRNWEKDVGPALKAHVDVAKEYGVCLAFYESGFHMRVDKINYNDLGHLGVNDLVRRYRSSNQQRVVEQRMYDEMSTLGGGPMVAYSNVSSAGNGAFAYWGSVFEDRASEDPRTRLIREYNDPREILQPYTSNLRRQLKRLTPTVFRSNGKRAWLFKKLRSIETALESSDWNTLASSARQISARVNGCGTRADANDYVRNCKAQQRLQTTLTRLRRGIALVRTRS